jgi:hypothetical protein
METAARLGSAGEQHDNFGREPMGYFCGTLEPQSIAGDVHQIHWTFDAQREADNVTGLYTKRPVACRRGRQQQFFTGGTL